jgi:[NiFe] hydrogenase assembly HybE family chaperone
VISTQKLTAYFQTIAVQRMQQLPIYNPRLRVETVGFREFDGDQLGVLITPWFVNLILLPGSDSWASQPAGAACELALPAGAETFTVCQDDVLGRYLSAVLFRSSEHFEDQDTARAIAADVMERLFQTPAPPATKAPSGISRRDLLRGASTG